MTESPWPIFEIDESGWPVPPHDRIDALPPAPSWRRFVGAAPDEDPKLPAGAAPQPFLFRPDEVERINAAMFLRRPLLITGKPGSGKSSLATAVAWQLKLGPLLRWPINTRSTLKEGLYRYDAIARLQDKQGGDPKALERYLTLGPLGTALTPRRRPRCLLIDEIDKSDIDLPNDLLDVLERGEFVIPELARLTGETFDLDLDGGGDPVTVERGRVACAAFPLVIMTSNGERGFPTPFLRRCIRLEMEPPSKEMLGLIVERHVGLSAPELVQAFVDEREKKYRATDQLLNAVFLLQKHGAGSAKLRDALLQALDD